MRVLVIVCFCILLMLFGAAVSVAAQQGLPAKNAAGAAPAPDVKMAGFLYKGIGIGVLADDVRKKLGEPKDKTDPQDLFVFSDEESAQFLYGPDKKVTAIMITFSGKLSGAPTPKDVFGEDIAPRTDGGLSKMVRYPKAGYWISYNKIVGDDSIISIAMQKM
jgi:hypothetical protein